MFDLVGILVLGAVTASSAFALLMLAPVPKRRLLGYVWAFDLTVSLGMLVAFAGSFAGTMTGFTAALMFSGMLRAARWWTGYEVFDFRSLSWKAPGSDGC